MKLESKILMRRVYEKQNFDKITLGVVTKNRSDNLEKLLRKISSKVDLKEDDKKMIYNEIFGYIENINENMQKSIKDIYKQGMKSIIKELENSKDNPHINLAKNIRYFRIIKHFSQEDLAYRLGVSKKAIDKWETGESEPEIDELGMMAKLFNIEVDVLLENPIKNKMIYKYTILWLHID